MSVQPEFETSFGRKLLSDFLTESFDRPYLEVFDRLTELYNKVNGVINISALRTVDDIYIKHYLDSIYPYKHFSGECCDVGCGGGFPCLPLSIVTGLNFTGLDSVGKKLTLIKSCIENMGLTNITPVHARAEELAATGARFDTVCARAVSNAEKALSFCAPLCKVGGKIVLYKTQTDEPISDKCLKINKIKSCSVEDYTIKGTDINRRLLIFYK